MYLPPIRGMREKREVSARNSFGCSMPPAGIFSETHFSTEKSILMFVDVFSGDFRTPYTSGQNIQRSSLLDFFIVLAILETSCLESRIETRERSLSFSVFRFIEVVQ